MGLLDKATIITTPTAHSNGKLHSIKGGAVADFDVVRGSAATRVNAEGLIEDISVLSGELVTNGDFATDSDWTYDGNYWSISGGRAIYNNGLPKGFYQSEVLLSSKSYKVSFDYDGTGEVGFVGTAGGSIQLKAFSNSYNQGHNSFVITPPQNTSAFNVFGNATGAFTISNISVKEVIDATNIPRIDYTTGEGVILTEPQSTNLVTYSEEFSNASWAKVSTAVVDDASTSPDGTINASSIELASGGYMYFTHSATINIGDKWTWSCFVKSSDQKITWGGGTPDGTDVYSIETLSNGWYRHILQRTFIASGINVQLMFSEAIAGADLFYVYGAQLEALPYATSYIPTSGVIATRLADSVSGAGDSSNFNSTEGVLYMEVAAISKGTNRSIAISDGTSSNKVSLKFDNSANTIEYDFAVGGVSQGIDRVITDESSYNKIACKWKVNDFALWVNGVEIGTDTSGATFPDNTLSTLSFDNGVGAGDFYGKTKTIAVFSEALTDEELTCLTTI